MIRAIALTFARASGRAGRDPARRAEVVVPRSADGCRITDDAGSTCEVNGTPRPHYGYGLRPQHKIDWASGCLNDAHQFDNSLMKIQRPSGRP